MGACLGQKESRTVSGSKKNHFNKSTLDKVYAKKYKEYGLINLA